MSCTLKPPGQRSVKLKQAEFCNRLLAPNRSDTERVVVAERLRHDVVGPVGPSVHV